MEERLITTMKNLQSNNIGAYYVNSKNELIEVLQTFIEQNEIVGCGDSITLEEMGVFNFLRNNEYCFLDKHKESLCSEDKREIYLKNFRADTFISGVNAISKEGSLYFIDGNGSRIAPIIYGPKQVIIVAGTNKIVDDNEKAETRCRQIAAPLDAKRLGKKTPCVITGKCIDCKSKDRICNDFLRVSRQFINERIKVIFIEGMFGY